MNDFREQLQHVKNTMVRSENEQSVDEIFDAFRSTDLLTALTNAFDAMKLAEQDAERQLVLDMRAASPGHGKFSKRIRERFSRREYVMTLNKTSRIVTLLDLRKKCRIWLQQIAVLTVSTQRGLLYFVAKPCGETLLVRSYTGHLFDRFAQRGGKTLDRTKAITKLLRSYADSESCFLLFNVDKAEAMDFSESGMLLGHFAECPFGEKNARVIAFRTFVSYDMLTPTQNELLAAAKAGQTRVGSWRMTEY